MGLKQSELIKVDLLWSLFNVKFCFPVEYGNKKKEFCTKMAATLGDIHLMWLIWTLKPHVVFR